MTLVARKTYTARSLFHLVGFAHARRILAVEPFVEVDAILENLVFVAVAPGFGLGVHGACSG